MSTAAFYMDLRGRGEGDVERTVEVIPFRLMVDVDEDGMALGIEMLGPEPLSMADLYACLLAARFPAPGRLGDTP